MPNLLSNHALQTTTGWTSLEAVNDVVVTGTVRSMRTTNPTDLMDAQWEIVRSAILRASGKGVSRAGV